MKDISKMIRDFTPQDTDAVVACWRAASAQAHPFLSDAFMDREEHNVRTHYLVQAETWVFDHKGRVVGFISLLENEVGGLFVDPGFQGRGYGRALVDRALAEKGKLELDVFADNPAGQAFYKCYGFQKISEGIHEISGHRVYRLVFPAR